MGRPVGSVNRQKPFTDALRVALLSPRIVAGRLVEAAEQRQLTAIQQIAAKLKEGGIPMLNG